MNHPRHILVFPVSLWNGMAGTRRVRVLVDELVGNPRTRCPYTVSNLSISDPKDYAGRPETGVEDHMPFCRIGYRHANPLTWLRFWYAGFRFMDRMRRGQRHNVVYCYQDTDLVTLPLLLLARGLGYKIVVDVVEDNTYLNKPLRNWLVGARVRSGVWLLNRLPRFADAAIAISSPLVKRIGRAAKGRIPIALIPISVNLDAIAPRPTPPQPTADGLFRLFYGGSFGAKDGLVYLLRAVALCRTTHPQLRLVLTGVGTDADMDEFRRTVAALGLAPILDYRGYLPDEAYRQALQGCDACCMTRTNARFAHAGFPFKLGEMLATGKPVIATSVGDVPTYLTDGDNALLIDPEQPRQLADRLRWLMAHPAQGLAIGRRGRQVAERHFSARRVAHRLDALFDELFPLPLPQPQPHEPYACHPDRL